MSEPVVPALLDPPSVPDLTDEEVTQYGIRFGDDDHHPYDPNDVSWNESWFWDWFSADGTKAGHCRIGHMPNQRRVWLWLYLYTDGEWVCLEQPWLDHSYLQVPALAYDRLGLRFSHDPIDPLRRGRLKVAGPGRLCTGPRAGQVAYVDVEVAWSATGGPHSPGQGRVEGHQSEGYDATRLEQPLDATARHTIDGTDSVYEARGERDHSWGPRFWNMEWTFLALSNAERRCQFVEVGFKGMDPILLGYLSRGGHTSELTKVEMDLVDHDDPVQPFSGRVAIHTDDVVTAGSIEVLAWCDMDVSHVLTPPRASDYRRSLIRLTPDEPSVEPLLGWLETNRLLPGDPDKP